MAKKKSIEPTIVEEEIIDTNETPVDETPVDETPVDFVQLTDVIKDFHEDDVFLEYGDIVMKQAAQTLETLRYNVLKAGTPVDETPVDETPVDETPVDEEPKSFTITLQGPKNQTLDYGINGTYGKLPCGVEITVSEAVYHAVKAHIISERD